MPADPDASRAAERPRLRVLEAFPVEHDGERAVGLRDPGGFTDQVAVLPIPLLDLVSLFDGDHSVAEMQEILKERYGEAPPFALITGIVDRLDEGGFLDSPGFAERKRVIEEAFRRSAVRPATHAGAAYAAEAAALREQLDAFFRDPEGPGLDGAAPGPTRVDRGWGSVGATRAAQIVENRARDLAGGDAKAGATGPPQMVERPASPRGIMAPHIDFHRGGPTYAWAYRDLAEAPDAPDLFVILGTCHAGMQDPFAITLKPYETPLGAAGVDDDFFEALARRYRHDLLASEVAHRAEHSIEFQVVMLRHVLGERRSFTIVPVLTSFVHEAMAIGADPEADPRVPRFVDALLETMAASKRRVCVVAGVDLAHVGPRFGDSAPNSPDFLRDVERADREMLEAVTAADPTGFYRAVSSDGDSRRICGLSPIYTFLRVLPGVPGRLLRYSQWPDPQGAVSFCAAVFP